MFTETKEVLRNMYNIQFRTQTRIVIDKRPNDPRSRRSAITHKIADYCITLNNSSEKSSLNINRLNKEKKKLKKVFFFFHRVPFD